MQRRTFLKTGAFGLAGISPHVALAHYEANGSHLAEGDLGQSIARLRRQFQEDFDAGYVENVIIPHFLVSMHKGEKPSLPMIGATLTKENALPYDLWGMLSETWKPN